MTELAATQTDAPENAAWASVAVPLQGASLLAFLCDVERLFRLNPYLEIESWQEEAGPFRAGKRYRLSMLNEMNGVHHNLTLTVTAVDDAGYTLAYDRGLKRATEIRTESNGVVSRVTFKDYYHQPDSLAQGQARDTLLQEVDKSLVPWAAATHAYLRGLARWSWLPPYRWYKQGAWLRMPPRQRRIVRLIVWTTLLEFIVFLFVFVIYWLESQRI